MAFTDRLHNRGSISTGYEIENSLKFEPDNSESLTKAAATGGDRKKATLSLWCKRTELTGSQASILFLTGVNGNKYTTLAWGTNDEINFHYYNAGSYPYSFLTDREFRDTSAWYHIVVAIDTAQGTAANRVKFYVNGVQETSFSTEVYPDQNIDTPFNNDSATYPMEIGNDSIFDMGGDPLAGYLADYYLIDGSQLAPTEFGEFDEDSGIWIPKAYTGSFGSNGFYLDFADAADLGDDESGNGNDFTEQNISAADQATDTPTNNFCTLNILQNYDSIVFTEGATSASTASGGNVKDHAEANMGFSSGKWYMEFYVTNSSASDDAMFGFGRPGLHSGINQNSPGNDTYSFGAHNVSRWYYNNQTWTNTGASGWDKGQVIQIAIDADNGKAWQGVNGTYSSGNPSTNTGGFDWGSLVTDVAVGDLLIPVTRTMYTGPGLTAYNYGGYTALAMNSVVSDENGYGSFEYAPPTGFYALCTKNLAKYGG